MSGWVRTAMSSQSLLFCSLWVSGWASDQLGVPLVPYKGDCEHIYIVLHTHPLIAIRQQKKINDTILCVMYEGRVRTQTKEFWLGVFTKWFTPALGNIILLYRPLSQIEMWYLLTQNQNDVCVNTCCNAILTLVCVISIPTTYDGSKNENWVVVQPELFCTIQQSYHN